MEAGWEAQDRPQGAYPAKYPRDEVGAIRRRAWRGGAGSDLIRLVSTAPSSSTLRRSLILGAARAYSRIALTERGAFQLMNVARRAIPREQWSDTFCVRGLKLQLDLAVYPDCCMAVGLYELDTLKVLKRLLCPGGWFVDGGANIGYFTLLAGRMVGPTGKVDAFEPDPGNRARLEAHLRDNTSANIRVHPVAVWDRSESIAMTHPTTDAFNHGMSGGYVDQSVAGERYDVQGVRLDERVEGVPDLVKLDVEGAEFRAVKGMSTWLTSSRPPALIIEHNEVTAKAAGYAPAELFRHITESQPRYRAYWIGMKLWPIPSVDDLMKINRQGNLLFQVEGV